LFISASFPAFRISQNGEAGFAVQRGLVLPPQVQSPRQPCAAPIYICRRLPKGGGHS